jgi:RNA polymerase sigma-70 factor (ECF subfamily)
MPPDLSTTGLHELLTLYQGGDAAALDELIRRAGARLERLARRMLRRFPGVRSQEQSGDVLQNALLRLGRSLREVRPASTADFFRLAAEHIRRELLDLARYHRRRLSFNQQLPPQAPEPPAPDAAEDLDRWQALHEAVERLPAELGEVFGLAFYHDWTQSEIAQLLGVSPRQVRRLWRDACRRLHELLGEQLPPP